MNTCPDCPDESCSTCRFWAEKVSWAEDGDTIPQYTDAAIIRANGQHFIAFPLDRHTPPQHLGFGGHLWMFQMLDGRQVVTNNVMHQGTIPAWFRDRLPDNAAIAPAPIPKTRVPFGANEGLS
ncbi:hypothetical protein ACFW81_23970 [Streptomyces angustmyceticus]|uniref:hypothetical protein n=1 Tax=Streptomyces angustmyceticus TaxID=285578 RepID=UPI0036ABE04A